MAAEKPASAATPARRTMKFRNKLFLIVFSLLAMAFLRSGFIFFLIGMLPSIVVYYLDQSPQRFTFRTIFACNMSGMLPYLGRMLRNGPTSSVLNDMMSAPSTWLIIYGAAAMGGILISITPMLAQAMIGSLHQTQVRMLQRNQKKIEQEWGKEVTNFVAEPDSSNS